jgi:hypothetical protein
MGVFLACILWQHILTTYGNKAMKTIFRTVFAALIGLLCAPMAQAGLLTNNFGTLITELRDCDDCTAGPFLFGGGQTINFFGNTYGGLYVSTNGYVTFDGPHTSYAADPIDQQVIGPMIAGLLTDLDTTDDPLNPLSPQSDIYVNASTTGEIVITFQMVTHAGDQTLRSNFQLLIRSDQKSIPAGEGQLGFFYGDITDSNLISAGFGDGLIDVNPGEVVFAWELEGTALSNSNPRFYTLNGGGPTDPPPTDVAEPSTLALLLLGIAGGLRTARRKRA